MGDACQNKLCRRRGYHHIPFVYAPSTADPPDRRIGQLWDAYLLVQKIGEGGVGAVYKAIQPSIMLEAALKVVSTESGSLAGRFRHEASALARLSHPNIVRLLHFGERRGEAYLVMEYVPGDRTLNRVAEEGLSVARIFAVTRQLVDALEAAHQLGIVHRDVKPANVMLQPLLSNPDFVRLVDFGLAKFTESGGSTRISAGTPAYMAPEQVTRRQIGPWTDWYALGVIVFELLTGQRAYPADSTMEIIGYKTRADFRPEGQPAAAHLPKAVRSALGRLMAHEPSERARTAEEVRALLSAAHEAMAAAFGDDYECHAGREPPDWALATSMGGQRQRHTLFDPAMVAAAPIESEMRPTLLTSDAAALRMAAPKATRVEQVATPAGDPVETASASAARRTLFYGSAQVDLQAPPNAEPHARAIDTDRAGLHGPTEPATASTSTPHGQAIRVPPSDADRLTRAMAERDSMPLGPVAGAAPRTHGTEVVKPHTVRTWRTAAIVGGVTMILLASGAMWRQSQTAERTSSSSDGFVTPVGDSALPRSSGSQDAAARSQVDGAAADSAPPDSSVDSGSGVQPDGSLEAPPARARDRSDRPRRQRPPSSRASLERGRRELKRGDWKAARQSFLRVPRGSPSYFEALLGSAEAARQLQDREGALRLIQEALQLEPRYAPAHELKANLLYRLGRRIEACESWRSAVLIDPGLDSAKRLHDRMCKLGE